jgi:hypothetical protein
MDGFQRVNTAYGTYITPCHHTQTPGLVVICTENHKVPALSLTHSASGMAVAYADSWTEVLDIAKRLTSCCDWKQERPDFTREQLEAVLGDLRHRAAYKWGASSGEPAASGVRAPGAP